MSILAHSSHKRALGVEVRCILLVLISLSIKYKYKDYLFNSIVDFIANATVQALLAERTHKIVGRDKSGAMHHEQNLYYFIFYGRLIHRIATQMISDFPNTGRCYN